MMASSASTWKDLPADAQCDLAWAWLWCRPCSPRDRVILRVWMRLGMPGGIPAFLDVEEPVWMVELLHRCCPDARLEHLETAVSRYAGRPAGSINNARTLRRRGGNSSAWVNEGEATIKAKAKELAKEAAPCPWSAGELLWMRDRGSLSLVQDVDLGPLRVTRNFADEAIHAGGGPATGRAVPTRWVAIGGVPGTAVVAFPGAPGFRGPGIETEPGFYRAGILLDETGWNPPGIPAGAGWIEHA